MSDDHFRKVLGHYPTGVVVVTAYADGSPIGMTLGTFGSVSLDPPLISFSPGVTSKSWEALETSGTRYCVNVLAEDQEHVCRAVAMRRRDKFAGIPLETSPEGNPVVTGSLAYIDCELYEKHLAGDHYIVVAKVQGLDVLRPVQPLLFLGGGYGSFGRPRGISLSHLPAWEDWDPVLTES